MMPSWRKYYPENFSSILYMALKLLLFEFCQKSAKIAIRQRQARFSQLTNEKSNQTEIFIMIFHWKCLVLEIKFVKNAKKCIFRGSRWLFGKL